MKVDAHHHLWDLSGRHYPFLDGPQMGPIRRSYGLRELRGVMQRSSVDRAVLVQTVAGPGESAEYLDLAAGSEGLVAGVVGWVDLLADDVPDQLARLRLGHGGELLCGVRHPVQGEADEGWLDRPEARRGVRAVAEAGLSYDLLVKEPHWPAALRLARELELPLVLNHAGNPPVASGELNTWRRWLHDLAAAGPHVSIKLSGLVTLADWRRWRVADLQPVVDAVLATFGPDRVLAGSDWPICVLAASSEQVWATHDAVLSGLSSAERHAVMGGTALRVYRLAS